MNDVTTTTEAPQGNSPEARDSTGTILDRSPSPTTTPSPTDPAKTQTTPEGGSTFLTGAKAEESGKGKDSGSDQPKPEGEPKPDTPSGAPETYTDFTVPEGFKFDDKALTEATAIFKELNLSQPQAQKLVDTYTKQLTESARAPYDLWANTQRQWHTDILSRFGGESGASRMSADINSVINTILPPSLQKSFRAALDFTGAGSNPDLLEGLSIMLKPHMEGKPVPSGTPTKEGQTQPQSRPSGPVDVAAAMYPHLVKNRPQ